MTDRRYEPLEIAERGQSGMVDPIYEPPGERIDPRAEAPKTDEVKEPVKFTPTPFKWRDPSTFPRRQFVYGRHYARHS